MDRAYTGARELTSRQRVEIGVPFHVRALVRAYFRTGDEALSRARIRIAEGGDDLASYLERARPDRGSKPRQHRCGLDTQRRDRGFDYTCCEPTPAGMHGCHRARIAVG